MGENEKIVFSFIPEKRKFEQPAPNDFDLFAKSRIKNLEQIESEFNQIYYEMKMQDTQFYTLRSKRLAE